MIIADADDVEINDSVMNNFALSFPMSGLSIRQMNICDKRIESGIGGFTNHSLKPKIWMYYNQSNKSEFVDRKK